MVYKKIVKIVPVKDSKFSKYKVVVSKQGSGMSFTAGYYEKLKDARKSASYQRKKRFMA